MISTEELSELLALLYAAPLEPQRWQTFLDRLSSLVHISCGYLVTSSSHDGDAVLAGGGLSFDPEILDLYNRYYGANDPYREPLTTRRCTGLMSGEELVPHAELLHTELYNDVLRRYHSEHMNMLCFNNGDEGIDALSLWRGSSQGPLTGSASQLLEALLPHLKTAIALQRKLSKGSAAAVFSEAALDAMSIAAFLVNGKSEVRHMNRLASSHLEAGGCLRLDKGKLTANDPTAPSGYLEQLIAQATSIGTLAIDDAPGASMRLSHFNVTVVPAPEQNQIAGHELYALVFVTDTRQQARSRAAVMRQLYGLTPAETRVADRLLDGLDVREIAECLGITRETCRFHLKRVLAKTGTRRQAELLRLMLSLPGQ